MINPNIDAASITPAAKERIKSENLWDIFLNKNPTSAPIIVAPPTPKAVIKTKFTVTPDF